MRFRSPRLLLVAACAGLFVAALDAYAVAALLPRMLSDLSLGVDRIEEATPIIGGFLGAYVVALPLVGALSDARGRVPAYLAALSVFVGGSVLTAFAPSLPWLVAGRAVQGLGGGALVPVALAMAADIFGGRGRALALGAVAGVQELGSMVGPAYGALAAGLGQGLGAWRFVFLLNLPLGLLVLVGVLAGSGGEPRGEPRSTANPGSRRGGPAWGRGGPASGAGGAAEAAAGAAGARDGVAGGDRPGSGDATLWAGAARWATRLGVGGRRVTAGADLGSAVLLGFGLGALVFGLYPDDPAARPLNRWSAPLLVAAPLLLGAYGWRQARRLAPLLPSRVLRSPSFLGALGANLLAGGALMVVLVDVPVFARAIFNVDQAAAGLLLTSFLVGVPVGAVTGGWLGSRVGLRAPAVAGMLGGAALFATLAGWGSGELQAHWWGLRRADVELAALGVAFGLVIAPLTTGALEASERREHGLVSSLVVAARTVGMLVALSSLTAYGLHRLNRLVAAEGTPPPELSLHDKLTWIEAAATRALVVEYHEIFTAAAFLCAAASVIAALTLPVPGPTRSPAPPAAARG